MRIQSHIIAYVDLLGFSNSVMSDEFRPGHLAGRKLKLDAMRNLVAEYIHAETKYGVNLTWMSDSLILSIPLISTNQDIVDDALSKISIAAGIFQCVFATEDYFVRGGIAVGPMVLSDIEQEPFGTGLIRAVELEKQVANTPRIVVSAVLSGYALHLKYLKNGMKIYVLDLNLPFIDYLVFAEVTDGWSGRAGPRIRLAGHAEMVHNMVVESRKNPELREKAEWLLDYHNWHIKKRGNFDDLIVKEIIHE